MESSPLPAATGTVPSAKGWRAPNGWSRGRPNCLPTDYFHVVFTLPQPIAAIAFYNRELVYDILFHATADTLLHHCRRSPASGRGHRLLRRTP